MDVKSSAFVSLAEIAIADPDLQFAVKKGTTTAVNKRLNAMFADGETHGEALRQQAAEAKRRALRDLPQLLERAEANMTANGIQVLWANDGAEVTRHVIAIAQQHHVKTIAKAKSMVSEEIGLNHVLEAQGYRVVETDLGEFIVQLNNETPSHLVTPIIHKTKESIRDVMVREINMPHTDDAQEMAMFAREYMRDVFLQADMGITGGNFIIAETGSICLVTNEGNGRMCTTLPKVHVAIIGIEKIVETVDDYATLTQVLPRSGTGQVMTVYTQMINAPCQAKDPDGAEHVYVILVDNGRSDIYATDYAEALACIRCGACLNACPVYQSTGGHAYGWVYSGPIGAVITPLLKGLENATPLPQASSLCGRCKQVCPVDIDLPRMLIDLRRDSVKKGYTGSAWDISMKLWAIGFSNPRFYTLGGFMARNTANPIFGRKSSVIKNLPGPLSAWTHYRDFPKFARKSFREMWQDRQTRKG
jgi:L-lactate dehydrogenase complex protein LldF